MKKAANGEGERCLEFSRMLLGTELTMQDIGDLLLTSQNYKHFRVSSVHIFAHDNVYAGRILAHWLKTLHECADHMITKPGTLEKPSFRQFGSEENGSGHFNQATFTTPIPAADLQRKLLAALACPMTGGPVDVIPTILAADSVREGLIVSRRLERVIGCIRNFQIDFIRFSGGKDWKEIRGEVLAGKLPKYESTQAGTRFESAFSPLFHYSGDWRRIGDDMVVTDCESGRSSIQFYSTESVIIHFKAHPWSSIIEIFVNGSRFEVVDLYEPHTAVPRDVIIPIAAPDRRTKVDIRSIGHRNSLSMGKQCLFLGCSFFDGSRVPVKYDKKSASGGAAFDRRFDAMLGGVPQSGLALDVGGGNRQLVDARYVNLDYAPYAEPDVIGDALRLPFRDETIDMVYSSGVFEHLRNPIAAAQEIYRVTKPGGRILIGIAFMQPIHSEGQHFFNCTPWGIKELFGKFEINDISWEGSLGYLVEWMLRTTHVDRFVAKEEIAPVLEAIRRWDTFIEYGRLKYIANGVWCVGTKTAQLEHVHPSSGDSGSNGIIGR